MLKCFHDDIHKIGADCLGYVYKCKNCNAFFTVKEMKYVHSVWTDT